MGYISSLLAQMEDTKRRMGGPLTASPDAFNVAPPPQGAPAGPPLAPTPQPNIPAAPAYDPFTNVANASVSDINDPSHSHRKGIAGGLLHLFGADRVQPELAALLTPDQQQRVKPGLLGTIWNAAAYGQGPQAVMQDRAENMLALGDARSAREKQMAQTAVLRKWAPVVMSARTPEERYQAESAMASEYATVVGMDKLGTIPSYLGAVRPGEERAQSPVSNLSWIPDASAPGGYRQLGSPAPKEPQYETFNGYRHERQPDGTWKRLGRASEDRPRMQVVPITNTDGTITYKWLREGEELTGQPKKAAGGRQIAEVLPTVIGAVGRLKAYTPEKIKALSTTGVNAATVAQKESGSWSGLAGAWVANAAGVVKPQDSEYANLIRGIADAVARANEIGILTNQDIQRYETQVSFVAGEPEAEKARKVQNAIDWAEWLIRNKDAIDAGQKDKVTPIPQGKGGRNPFR